MGFLNNYVLIGTLLLGACTQTDWESTQQEQNKGITFTLRTAGYDNLSSRSGISENTRYSRVEYYIVDEHDELVKNIRTQYDTNNSEIMVEGLHSGNYRLLILAIKGDETKDRAIVHRLQHAADVWLTFPEDLQKPLEAEYFYSRTPFTVSAVHSEQGDHEVTSLQTEVSLKRIAGKAVFDFRFRNPYVENGVWGKQLIIDHTYFYTSFAADSTFSGQSNGQMDTLSLDNQADYSFFPTVAGNEFQGRTLLCMKNYRGEQSAQDYHFEQSSISPNLQNKVMTHVTHPDDLSGVVFMTAAAYEKGNYNKILQDDEPKEIYTNRGLRSFNTSSPLQISFTDNGQLHARFYSPRKLSHVLVKVLLPSVSSEYFDLAYFEELPPFADFYQSTPLTERTAMYRTESGRQIELSALKASDLSSAQFKIESDDEYWSKLQKIVHGWDIYWGLYGGNPDLDNGGPTGNWMGIRPVHCRESIALFLNFTYMLDTPEHEQILRENEDILYGNGGTSDKVTADKVLQQMRQKRTLCVGLVYPGHGVLGLGGGSTFGAYQQAWLQHYWNTYSCEIMFHELGHVMGYSHSSSFTYGPWAQKLMNNFYVNNIKNFPINSSGYLNSSSNPYIYK